MQGLVVKVKYLTKYDTYKIKPYFALSISDTDDDYVGTLEYKLAEALAPILKTSFELEVDIFADDQTVFLTSVYGPHMTKSNVSLRSLGLYYDAPTTKGISPSKIKEVANMLYQDFLNKNLDIKIDRMGL